MTALFIGKSADSLSWPKDRHNEAVATLKALRIRPTRLTVGYCQVTYEAYTKLRLAGLLSHRMSGE